ncbi:hypothetical protein [Mycobacterium riyadhense]|uniref:Uncharacterized protein n=2 Tax=Mycobacterium riyadhense TaxID=486698 RepID=A0A653EZ85_9MYCO|nr:hypothetical protein [Mycobacterium riyadhense]VTP02845.1 hypothetical protein BIN_B_04741 [Mycobacterium riyadhense]
MACSLLGDWIILAQRHTGMADAQRLLASGGGGLDWQVVSVAHGDDWTVMSVSVVTIANTLSSLESRTNTPCAVVAASPMSWIR